MGYQEASISLFLLYEVVMSVVPSAAQGLGRGPGSHVIEEAAERKDQLGCDRYIPSTGALPTGCVQVGSSKGILVKVPSLSLWKYFSLT